MQYTQTQLAELFPINSQTSLNDKVFLLNAKDLVKKLTGDFTYIEIGSFLGGSLAPFLSDAHCKHVLSIDERERKQEDERGMKFDYAGITHQTMISNLAAHNISTKNLQTFDGSIDAFAANPASYDLGFIDGEHTDFSCFRDYLWMLPMMKKDSIIMFHDSNLVYKALKLIQLHLRKSGLVFKFFKKADSAMSCILLGKFAAADAPAIFGNEHNLEVFYEASEVEIINHLITNRVVLNFNATVVPQKTVPAY